MSGHEDTGEWQGNGDINRDGAWMFYTLMNAFAIYFNLSLIISVQRLKTRRTGTDILIAGLSSGVVVAASGCGPQCLINLVKGTFAYGTGACFAEAFLHLIGMEIQFLAVAAIAHRTYVGVKLQVYSIARAYWTIFFIWVFSVSSTLGMGSISGYYLVQSGTFCFYKWTSPALIFLAWPMATIATICMVYWYWYSFKIFKQLRERESSSNSEHDHRNIDKDLSIRLAFLVFLFVLGYCGIICQSFYEITIGRAAAWGDVIAAVLVLIYWVSVAFAYAYANKRLGIRAVLVCAPAQVIQQDTITPESLGLPSIAQPSMDPTNKVTSVTTSPEITKKQFKFLSLFQPMSSSPPTPSVQYHTVTIGSSGDTESLREMSVFLATEAGNQAFRKFLETEHSVENLEFYNAVVQLHDQVEHAQRLLRRSVEGTPSNEMTQITNSHSTSIAESSLDESTSSLELRLRGQLIDQAKKIYVTYIYESSPKVVTVSHEVKEKLQAEMADLIDEDEIKTPENVDEDERSSLVFENIRLLFYEGFMEISRVMEGDSFPRFMQTPEYQTVNR